MRNILKAKFIDLGFIFWDLSNKITKNEYELSVYGNKEILIILEKFTEIDEKILMRFFKSLELSLDLITNKIIKQEKNFLPDHPFYLLIFSRYSEEILKTYEHKCKKFKIYGSIDELWNSKDKKLDLLAFFNQSKN